LNLDQLADLKSFNQKFPAARLDQALEHVEASIALVGKNGYLPLILTGLAIDLKSCLLSKTS
jgi:hypothetical protein